MEVLWRYYGGTTDVLHRYYGGMLDALWGGQAVVTRESGQAWAHSRVGDASARRPDQPYQGLADAPAGGGP